jgi:hypothetical protein
MKAYSAIVGTVLLATLNVPGREKLNLSQVMILTPQVAGAVGLSYEDLYQSLAKENPSFVFGAPIQVRLMGDKPPVISNAGPIVTLPMENVAPVSGKSIFSRSI